MVNCKTTILYNNITFYGKVTLKDTTDYSGVKVMLFAPVKIDTIFINLNKNFILV